MCVGVGLGARVRILKYIHEYDLKWRSVDIKKRRKKKNYHHRRRRDDDVKVLKVQVKGTKRLPLSR